MTDGALVVIRRGRADELRGPGVRRGAGQAALRRPGALATNPDLPEMKLLLALPDGAVGLDGRVMEGNGGRRYFAVLHDRSR